MIRTIGTLAIAFGLYFAACEVLGTWEYLTQSHPPTSYVVLLGLGIAAAVAALPSFASTAAFLGRYGLALGLWAAFVVALAVVVAAATQRTASASDTDQARREHGSLVRDLARRAEAEAKTTYDKAISAAERECEKRGPECRKMEAKRDEAKSELAQARVVLSRSAVITDDALAGRIAAVTGISEARVRLYLPLLIPVAGSLFPALLLNLGVWALAFRPGPPPSPVTERPSNVVAMGKSGSVAQFLATALAPATGNRVDLAQLIAAYRAWCQTQRLSAVPAQTVVDALAGLAAKGRVRTEVDGRSAYLLDVRLSS